jgi:predicted DNA-binding transcriptional regulator YafY
MSDVDTLCETLVSRLNDGERVTLTALSNQFNATSAEIRKYLIDKFGSRISFQRGRTGGIRLA